MDDKEPSLLKRYTLESMRDDPDISEGRLDIEVWDTGTTIFNWSKEDGLLVEQVEFCVNAYFNMLITVPQWFANLGEPSFFGSCDMPTMMFGVHDNEYPNIALGVLRQGEESPLSVMVLDRGTVLTTLDAIGHQIAVLEDVVGCEQDESDDFEEPDDDELVSVPDANDPFAGIDTTVRH